MRLTRNAHRRPAAARTALAAGACAAVLALTACGGAEEEAEPSAAPVEEAPEFEEGTTMAAIAEAPMIWSAIISALRRPRRSSHAPRSGAVTSEGKVIAATSTPARAALPVRSSTSSTTPTENISSAIRENVAAPTKRR